MKDSKEDKLHWENEEHKKETEETNKTKAPKEAKTENYPITFQKESQSLSSNSGEIEIQS